MLSLFTVYLSFTTFVHGSESEVFVDDEGKFRCPWDPLTSLYPNSSDESCLSYFLCHLGHAFLRGCQVRTAFHPDKKECISRKEIPEDICPYAISCNRQGYYPDPEDCTKYYLCFYKQPTHYGCDENYVFDPNSSSCKLDKAKSKDCIKPKPIPVKIEPMHPKASTTTRPPAIRRGTMKSSRA